MKTFSISSYALITKIPCLSDFFPKIPCYVLAHPEPVSRDEGKPGTKEGWGRRGEGGRDGCSRCLPPQPLDGACRSIRATDLTPASSVVVVVMVVVVVVVNLVPDVSA